MPPILKISTEMVVEAALSLADKIGIEGVNCRAVAAEIGCSTQPVFSRFPNMEELKTAVFHLACNRIEEKILSEEENHLEKAVLVLSDLARNHKNLFKLVYLSDYCSKASFVETRMSYTTNQLLFQELKEAHSFTDEKASELFERIELLVHGIMTVIATTNMDYPDEKILDMVQQTINDAASAS